MGTRTSKEILVETDFLFGLNPEDKLHSYVKKIINKHNKGEISCRLAGTALMEFRAVLYSHGLTSDKVYEALLIIINALNENNISIIPVRPEHIMAADLLRTKYSSLTYYDALHAGVAYEEGILLVSYDDIYAKIREINFLKMNEL